MRVALLLIVAVCFTFQAKPLSQCNSVKQGIRRDLARYDKAGPYRFDNDLHPQEADNLRGKLREFLWQHWKEQRLGTITGTFYTIEGDPTDSSYFIEPNARGIWYLRIDSKSTVSALLRKGQKPKIINTCDEYDTVERVELSRATTVNLIPVRDTEVRDPQKYKLRLTNSLTKATQIL